MTKHRFLGKISSEALNQRQILMINKLLDEFEGNLTTSKWGQDSQVFAGYGIKRCPGPDE
ncbi:MAG: hypothetical protein MZV63_50835 [Marinilabiliales bacterium]|nr:hypothetical protein [Marinilabiliales bacterium]